jgi:molybdopterin molybdotransferase
VSGSDEPERPLFATPGSGLIPVERHLADCLDLVGPLPPIEVPLVEALGCVLAEDVAAGFALPAFDNSGMDGYAVRSVDVAAASESAPVVLPVTGDVFAGPATPVRLAPGTAMRIMTGAPVPEGADAVVPVESTDGGLAEVVVRRSVPEGASVRRAGEDVDAGDVVLRAGARLTPRQLALLAAVGRPRAVVHPRPRVVVLSTGAEVVEPGQPLLPGQVYDANGIGLTAAADELGARAVRVGIVDDDPRAVRAAVEDQLGAADVLVTSGGVSAGAADVVKAVLAGLGEVTFRRVAVNPGMPQGLGVLGPGRVPVFCLPGNPVSAQVSFEVFVRPALRRILGESRLHRRRVPARVLGGWTSPAGKRQYARVLLMRDQAVAASATTPYVAEPATGQGSHLAAQLAHANALAVVPESVTEVAPGDVLDCLVLERMRR